jgi:hypothetical protein
MSELQSQSPTLHERTLHAVQEVLQKALNQLSGLERTMVGRGAQMILPRVESRIRSATEGDLRASLKQIQYLLDKVLGEPQEHPPEAVRTKRKKKRSHTEIQRKGHIRNTKNRIR